MGRTFSQPWGAVCYRGRPSPILVVAVEAVQMSTADKIPLGLVLDMPAEVYHATRDERWWSQAHASEPGALLRHAA